MLDFIFRGLRDRIGQGSKGIQNERPYTELFRERQEVGALFCDPLGEEIDDEEAFHAKALKGFCAKQHEGPS